MLENLKQKHGEFITSDILKEAFIKNIGCEYRLKKNGIEMMISMNMIEELEDGRVKII